MIAYKGFDKDLRCKGFQYEIGKTYEEPEAELCKCGFHACKYPLDVFRYYAPSSSRYCVVELEDVSESTDANETKCCAKKITILREITVNDMIQASVSYLKKHYNFNTTNTGDRSAATNTGDQSAATNTGYRSAATNTGDQSAATNTGSRSVASNTGFQSAATNTGDWGTAEVSCKESVAIVTGRQSKAAGAIGCWLVLTERVTNGCVLNMQAVKVDGNTIKPNVYYTLIGGKVVEAE